MTTADEIFANVLAAMQSAEEMEGPEGADYENLMRRIANEAERRINNFRLYEPDDALKRKFH